jgi:hypothetical protein
VKVMSGGNLSSAPVPVGSPGLGDDPDVGLEGSFRPPKISLVSMEADTLRVGPNPANTEPRRATFIDPVTAAAAPFSARPPPSSHPTMIATRVAWFCGCLLPGAGWPVSLRVGAGSDARIVAARL